MTIVGVKRLIKENGIKYLINIGEKTKSETGKLNKVDKNINKTLDLLKIYNNQCIEHEKLRLNEIKIKLLELRLRMDARIKTSHG